MIDYSNEPDELIALAFQQLQQQDDLYVYINTPELPLVLKRFWLMQDQSIPDLLDYPEEAPTHEHSQWLYDVLCSTEYEQRNT